MSELDYHRESDKTLYQLVQKFDDFATNSKEWQKEHDRKSDEWRASIDTRFRPLEDFINGIGTTKKIIFSGLSGIGAVASFGFAVYKFVKRHG